MSIYKIGRICLKLAGRDAGRKCAIVEVVDDRFVVVDGNVRSKKVNVKHLEPLAEEIEVGKGSHEEVKAAFEKLSLAVWEKRSKEKKDRPRKVKKKKVVAEKSKKEKKAEIKEVKKAKSKEKVAVKEDSFEEAVEAEVPEKKKE